MSLVKTPAALPGLREGRQQGWPAASERVKDWDAWRLCVVWKCSRRGLGQMLLDLCWKNGVHSIHALFLNLKTIKGSPSCLKEDIISSSSLDISTLDFHSENYCFGPSKGMGLGSCLILSFQPPSSFLFPYFIRGLLSIIILWPIVTPYHYS